MYVFIFLVKVTEWPPIGKIAAHSAHEMFSWYKYLIVSLVFSQVGFWSGNLFLIAPFPDLCLLVPFYTFIHSSEDTSFPSFKSFSLTPSITEIIQCRCNLLSSFVEINVGRKSIFRTFRNNFANSSIRNCF